MFSHINDFLSKKIELSQGITIDVYSLFIRSILYLITVSWIAFYPTYLLLIHMNVEKFFSYDVFVNGLFGIKSFLFLVFILITISALYLWGFIILFRKAIISKSSEMWLFGALFVLLSITFHIVIISSGLSSGKPERIFWISILGLCFAIAISSYMANPLKNFVSNWLAPVIGIFATATLPVLFNETSSDIVKTGLESFKVGGGIKASVYKLDNDKVIRSGKLLLLTPQYIYLREDNTGYISISRNNNTYISVH